MKFDPERCIEERQRIFGFEHEVPHEVRRWYFQGGKMEELMATGKEGEAVVLAPEDTGVTVNDNPRVSMVLEIHIEGYAPYQVEKALVVPLIRIPQVQPGEKIGVLADPNEPDNPDKVAIMLK